MHTKPFEPFDLSIFAMCRSSSPRAYALRKLPCEVTRNIDSFRDFKLEAVIKNGGTPSALAMKGYSFKVKCPDLSPEYEKWAAWGYATADYWISIKALGTNHVRYLAEYENVNDWRMLPEVFQRTPHTLPAKKVQRYAVLILEERGFLDFTPAEYYEVDSD